MAPSIGRIVLYRKPKSEDPHGCWHAAIITRVWTRVSVNLTVFLDAASPVFRTEVARQDIAESEGPCWEWPPRVE